MSGEDISDALEGCHDALDTQDIIIKQLRKENTKLHDYIHSLIDQYSSSTRRYNPYCIVKDCDYGGRD